jgi:hypothetical protein
MKPIETEHHQRMQAVKSYIDGFSTAIATADVNDMAVLATVHAQLTRIFEFSSLQSGRIASGKGSPDRRSKHAPEGAIFPKSAGEETSQSLSYKFQRLRENLRQAIASGELSGKLPGERVLARRFHVNSKTLSKALTDLAAEGVLDRSVGRGTFVKGSAELDVAAQRWLLVCDPAQTGWDLVKLLSRAHPEIEVLTDVASSRPSFLNQFGAVIVLSKTVQDSFLRDLAVRNIPVVVVGQDPRTYSTHTVCFDGPLAVSLLGRDLFLGGHRRFAAVEPAGCTVVADTLRQQALRYASDAVIHACLPQDAIAMTEAGVTAFVCQNVEIAAKVGDVLEKQGISVPGQVSVAAVGSTSDNQPVSGYFISRTEKANTIVQLLGQRHQRPTTIWLAGKFVDRGTTAPVGAPVTFSAEPSYQTAA